MPNDKIQKMTSPVDELLPILKNGDAKGCEHLIAEFQDVVVGYIEHGGSADEIITIMFAALHPLIAATAPGREKEVYDAAYTGQIKNAKEDPKGFAEMINEIQSWARQRNEADAMGNA